MTNTNTMQQAIKTLYNEAFYYDDWFFKGDEGRERYDYEKSIYAALIIFLEDMTEKQVEDFAKMDNDEREEWLNDNAFISDTVTGNASGSFFFNAWKAEAALAHNWELIEETQSELGPLEFSKGPEYVDVCVRCYKLGEIVGQVITAINDKLAEIEAAQ